MKNFLTFLFFILYLSLIAQPTFIGTMLPDGNYTTYNLNDLGDFRQVRLQATSDAAANARIWEFATGNYFENWRPYTFPTTIVMNQVIDPATQAASARYNTSFGGGSSFLPSIISGNYYTFNVTEFSPPLDQFMSLLETTFNPVTINSVTASPVGDPNENVPVNITVSTSAVPASGEQVFIRYTTDNFITSTIVQLSFIGSTATALIPGFLESTTVEYYIYSSNISSANILAEVASKGELAHDMLSLNVNNNGGAYSYVVQGGLPVSMSSFKIESHEKGIELKWETASELNNNHFDLERSRDTREWMSIAQINGKGTTNLTSKYAFIDKFPSKGDNYYRLKQVDHDDAFSYSSVLSADWKKDIIVEIYPNPVRDQIFFKHLGTDAVDQIINIFDLNGRQVFKGTIDGNSVDIQHLEKGIYMIQFIQNEEKIQKRIVVID